MDALFADSNLDEMAQLIMLQQQNPPEAQETRVGFFYEDTFEGQRSHVKFLRKTIFRPKPNYIKLELKFSEDRSEFTGSGIHLANKQAFEVVEGAVNKKTKYWKFICAYEGGRKKASGRKELVQVLILAKTGINCILVLGLVARKNLVWRLPRTGPRISR